MNKLTWGSKKAFNFFAIFFATLILVLNLANTGIVLADEPTSTPEPSATPIVTPESSQSPTPAPTVSPSPVATTEPTSTPTIDPSPNPTLEPTPTPSTTPTPNTTPEATSSAVPSPSSTPAPTVSPSPVATSSALPAGTLELNRTYSTPQNANVRIKFTNLPNSTNNFTFNTSTLSAQQISRLGALDSTAYEITSNMTNGTFIYDLTLPYPTGVTGTNFKVFYAENVNGLNNPNQVTQSITDNGDGTFTIHNLNHFTVFVVVNPNSQPNCDAITIGTTPGSTCYTTVQAAVNAATDGDTINIGNTGSPYNEAVYVNKQLTITGSGNPSVNAFVLQTTPVTITGITTSVSIATPTIVLTNPVNNGNQTTASITGTGAANATVNYTITGISGLVSGTGIVSASGSINISVDVSSLPEGALTLKVYLDNGGNFSDFAFAAAFKDTTGPAQASGLTITNPINIGNNTNISFSGNGEAGTTVTWTLSNGVSTLSGTTTVSGAGTFSVTGQDISSFPDGTITLSVILTDSAGNTSFTSITTATKDTVAPTVSAGSNVTTRTSFITSASSSDPAPSSGGLTYSWVKTSGPGTIAFGNSNALNTTVSANTDGTYVITLTVTDGAGNSNSSSFTLVWDTTNPTVSGLSNSTTRVVIAQTATVTDAAPSSGGLTYSWSQVSGPGIITFGSSSALTSTISADTDGTYTLKLTATDSAGNSGSQTITLVWDTTNPTVNAGSNQVRRSIFTQTGTAIDSLSGVATTVWSQISGPGTITFGSSNSLTSTISADTDGTYVIQLTATDNAGNVNTSTFTLTWDTTAPFVLAGAGQTTNALFTQTGSGSDSLSGIASYLWAQISGPGTITFGSPNALTTTVSASVDGTYIIRLTITDNAGNSAYSNTTIVWDQTKPTVSAGTLVQNQKAIFTQTGIASDSLSGVATVTWSKISGPGTLTFGTVNATTTTISADADGTYVIQLSATDNAGNTDVSTFTLNWDTVAPTVNAGANLNSRTTFTTSATATDAIPSTGIASYLWAQISGPGTITFGSASSLNTTVSANADGTYVIQLTVTDNAGNSNSSTFTLVWDTMAPIVNAGSNISMNLQFVRNGVVTDPAPSAGGLTYSWSQVSGPGTITFGTPSAIGTTISANVDGTYVIQLTATDAAGNSNSSAFTLVWDTVLPTVSAGANVSKNALFTTTATASDSAPSSGIASYLWSVVSGPGTITFGNASSLNTTISASLDGTYVIQLTVTDNAGNSNTSTFTLVWDTVNPTVNAGSNVVTNNLFTQTGVVTDGAPSSGGLTYSWTQVSGPGTLTFGTVNAVSTTISANTDGVYVIMLTATDAAGNTNNSSFTLTWDQTLPTVSAGTNQVKNTIFTQTGIASDSLSGIATTVWSTVSGPGVITFGSPNALTTTVSASVDGTYIIQLTVTDNAGNANNSTFTLVWDTAVPTVNAGANQVRNAVFTQTGTSTDPAPSSGGVTYLWTQISGVGTITFGSSTSLVTTISASADGVYVIQLTATDAAGNTNSSQFTLTWDTTNPTVSAGTNQLRNVIFAQTGTASDALSGVATTVWSTVSGPGTITFGTPNALTTTISASADGVYVIKLTVTDNAGNVNTSTFTLTWDTTAPITSWTTPVANSTVSGIVALTASSTDTNGVALTYLYKRNDGIDTFHTITTLNASPFSTNWVASGLALDSYTLRITSVDSLGNSVNVDQIIDLATVINQASINTGSISSRGVVISWTTADPTGSRIIYDTISHPVLGTPPNYGYANSTPNFDVPLHVLNHSVTLGGLTPNTTYYYRTVSSGSPEAVSNEFSFTTLSATQALTPAGGSSPAPTCSDTKPGSAPVLLSAKVVNGKVILTWSKAKDPVSYYSIEYGLGHDSYQYGVPTVGNVTSFEIGGLQIGATYYFRVRAGNGCNAGGEFSNELSTNSENSFATQVVNVASNLLGAKQALAKEESTVSEESTQSASASSSSAVDSVATSSSKIDVKKSANNLLKDLLIGSGIVLLIASGAFYYSTLKKKS